MSLKYVEGGLHLSEGRSEGKVSGAEQQARDRMRMRSYAVKEVCR